MPGRRRTQSSAPRALDREVQHSAQHRSFNGRHRIQVNVPFTTRARRRVRTIVRRASTLGRGSTPDGAPGGADGRRMRNSNVAQIKPLIKSISHTFSQVGLHDMFPGQRTRFGCAILDLRLPVRVNGRGKGEPNSPPAHIPSSSLARGRRLPIAIRWMMCRSKHPPPLPPSALFERLRLAPASPSHPSSNLVRGQALPIAIRWMMCRGRHPPPLSPSALFEKRRLAPPHHPILHRISCAGRRLPIAIRWMMCHGKHPPPLPPSTLVEKTRIPSPRRQQPLYQGPDAPCRAPPVRHRPSSSQPSSLAGLADAVLRERCPRRPNGATSAPLPRTAPAPMRLPERGPLASPVDSAPRGAMGCHCGRSGQAIGGGGRHAAP
jgi:hypothetical protein